MNNHPAFQSPENKDLHFGKEAADIASKHIVFKDDAVNLADKISALYREFTETEASVWTGQYTDDESLRNYLRKATKAGLGAPYQTKQDMALSPSIKNFESIDEVAGATKNRPAFVRGVIRKIK